MAVPSNQTELGHLALVIPADEFKDANGHVAWVEPINPGTKPVDPTANIQYPKEGYVLRNRTNVSGGDSEAANTNTISAADQQLIDALPFKAAETIRQFNEDKAEYRTYLATKTALRNLIINSVDDKYINALKQRRTHYTLRSPLELILHIKKEYGQIDQYDMTANEERMRKPWSPPEPMETLLAQLTEGYDFGIEGGETISDEQIIRWGIEIISKNEDYVTHCQKWDDEEDSKKTWKHFSSYFLKAEKKVKQKKQLKESNGVTTGDMMYTANQVQEIVDMQVLDAVNTALAAAGFNKENDSPAPPKESANATTGVTKEDIQAMISSALNSGKTKQDKSRGKGDKKQGQHKAQALVDGIPVTYCHSHGVTRNLSHNSKTCTHRRDGHKEEATYDNRMGGADGNVNDNRK